MLRLDEALFDDDFTTSTGHIANEHDFDRYKIDDYDDTPFIYEPIAETTASAEHGGEAIPEGPKPGIESGIADTLIKLINDEYKIRFLCH